jgi:hypothetical protein
VAILSVNAMTAMIPGKSRVPARAALIERAGPLVAAGIRTIIIRVLARTFKWDRWGRSKRSVGLKEDAKDVHFAFVCIHRTSSPLNSIWHDNLLGERKYCNDLEEKRCPRRGSAYSENKGVRRRASCNHGRGAYTAGYPG